MKQFDDAFGFPKMDSIMKNFGRFDDDFSDMMSFSKSNNHK